VTCFTQESQPARFDFRGINGIVAPIFCPADLRQFARKEPGEAVLSWPSLIAGRNMSSPVLDNAELVGLTKIDKPNRFETNLILADS